MIVQLLRTLTPLAALSVATWLIYDGQERLAKAKESRSAVAERYATAKEAELAMERIATKYPLIARTENELEELTFLNGLRKHASLKDVDILKWATTEELYSEPQLKGLKRVSSHISVVGNYANLFNFVEAVSSSPRLYTFSDLRWSRYEKLNRLDVSITRFLEPSVEEKP